jgi:hypothetical protein
MSCDGVHLIRKEGEGLPFRNLSKRKYHRIDTIEIYDRNITRVIFV